MVSRPKSPTSLLWAHELKRQHEFLFQRQRDLEASNEDMKATVAQVQSNVHAAQDQVLAAAGSSTTNATLQEQASEIQSLVRRIILLEERKEKMDQDMDKAFEREMSTLKRINGLEASQEEAKNTLVKFEQKLEDSGTADIKAKTLEMEAAFERLENQLRNLTQVLHEGRLAHMDLTSSFAQLERKFRALGKREAQLQAPHPDTLPKDTSETQNETLSELQRRPGERRLSHEVTSRILELLHTPQVQEGLPENQTPRFTEDTPPPDNDQIPTSPLARKHQSLDKQPAYTKGKENRKKRPAPKSPTGHSEPRRSQRIARQPVQFHGLDETPTKRDKKRITKPNNAIRANKDFPSKRTIPKPTTKRQSADHLLNPRIGLVEKSAAANRGSSSSSTLSEISNSPKTPRSGTFEAAQRQTPTMHTSLPKSKSQLPLSEPPRTPVRSPKTQGSPEQKRKIPGVPQRLGGSGPNASEEESPPWQVPTFMLPDFLVPPDWYRPNGR